MAGRKSFADLHHGGRLTARRQRPVRGLVRGCLLTVLGAFALLVVLAIWSGSRSLAPPGGRIAPGPIVAADPQPATVTPPPADASIDPANQLLAGSPLVEIPDVIYDPPAASPPSFLEPEAYPKPLGFNDAMLSAVMTGRGYSSLPKLTPRNISKGVVGRDLTGTITGNAGDAVQLLLDDYTSAFLIGPSARGIVSGKSFTTAAVIVEGTRQYQTVLGATRVAWVLREITSAEWSDAEAFAKSFDRVAERNALRTEYRNLKNQLVYVDVNAYTSADGAFTTEASVTGYDRDAKAYQMVRADGRSIDVPEDRLDPESAARARTIAARITSAQRRMEAIEAKLRD